VQGLALDFAEKKIAVIDVQPGPTATDMAPKDEARRAWLANASPEKRIADADEIARFVTYLASRPISARWRRKERGRSQDDGGTDQPARADEQRAQAGDEAIREAEVGGPFAGAIENQ
jgi:NAD(P)-dependent dehydrogenase (short-subunit alcohol dehydrogenase family)